MPDFPPDDQDFEEHTVDRVNDEDHHWSIVTTEKSMLGFPKVEGATPTKGSKLRTYPQGMGRSVRGVFVDGKKVYYRTQAEENESHAKWVAAEKVKKQKVAEENAEVTDERVSKLPQPLQDRIHGFRARNPEFRAEFEPYELFCCEQAAGLATALKTPEAIEAFSKAPFAEQAPLVDHEHSGNTLGFSIRLAHFLVSKEDEAVEKFHGAMCPLVGCPTYGCYAASPEAAASRAKAEAEGKS